MLQSSRDVKLAMQTHTEKAAAYISGLQYQDLPEDVVQLNKNCLLDSIGCILAGSLDAETREVAKGAVEVHRGADATAWSLSRRASVAGAAMVNVICAEAEDFTYALGGGTIVPTVLAVAEKERRNGREVLTALAAAHEFLWRIHKSVSQFALQSRGFYPQGVCAPFGPAAAVARLLDLDSEQTHNALSLAAGTGVGIRAYAAEGRRTKQLYLGSAAAMGATVAYLARAGMEAARYSIEGEETGFLRVFGGDAHDAEALSFMLGEEFLIRRTAFKLYPACRYMHTSIDAARELAASFSADEIERIEVRVPTMAVQVVGPRPIRSSYDCQFSIPWGVAVTLMDGTGLTSDQVSGARVGDAGVLALSEKVDVVADPAFDAVLEAGGLPPVVITSRIRLLRRDGGSHEAVVEYARGSAENPASQEDLHQKFRSLARRAITDSQAGAIIDMVENIESLNDLSSLTQLLSHRP